MSPRSSAYTSQELIDMLKDRQGGLTLQQFAREIGISFQYLSQIYLSQRNVGCQRVLEYLSPRGKKFVHQDIWYLVDD